MSTRTATSDGYTSAAILGVYLEKHFKQFNVRYLFHSGKQHGITNEIMKQVDEPKELDILFVPDAGSNDIEKHKELYERGIPVIVLDHHEATELSQYAVVVNNQLSPEYENKQLSGVGVTYKYLKKLDEYYGLDDADSFLDCVMLGNVSDVMQLTSPETRYYVYEGLKNIQNGLLKEMIFKNIGKWDKVYPHSLAFNLIPKINATIRFGSMDEKKDLFHAMIGREEIFYNTRSKKEETLQQKATRQGTNAHKRQGDTKKKWLKIIREQIKENNLDNSAFIVITFSKDEKFDNTLTGVIASSISGEYRKPVLILHYNENKDTYFGSLRGHDVVMSDTKTYLESLGLFEWITGHEQAAGCSIKAENLDKLHDKVKLNLNFDATDKTVEVDFVMNANTITKQVIEDVYSYEKYWGKGLENPLFALVGVKVDMTDVKVSDGGMIKWNINGIDYTQFVASKELGQYAGKEVELVLDVVGSMGVNTFLGKTSHQVIIQEVWIKEVKEIEKKKFKFEF